MAFRSTSACWRRAIEIQIGNSLFLFLVEETQTAPMPAVRLDERSVLTGATVILRSEDSRYLQPDKVATAPLPALRVARDLKALLKISTADQFGAQAGNA